VAKIKVIDDDVDHAEDLAGILADYGHTVTLYHDVEGAVEDLLRDVPDLLVLDVMFPEDAAAGLGLARNMRCSGDGLDDVPVLLLTAVNQRFPMGFSPNDIDDEWLPVTDFVEKPVELNVLGEKVKAVLARAHPDPPADAESQ